MRGGQYGIELMILHTLSDIAPTPGRKCQAYSPVRHQADK